MQADSTRRIEVQAPKKASGQRIDLFLSQRDLGLSRALVAQGRQDEAITVLTDASSQDINPGLFRQQVAEELGRLNRAVQKGTAAKTNPEQESAGP